MSDVITKQIELKAAPGTRRRLGPGISWKNNVSREGVPIGAIACAFDARGGGAVIDDEKPVAPFAIERADAFGFFGTVRKIMHGFGLMDPVWHAGSPEMNAKLAGCRAGRDRRRTRRRSNR